MPDLTLTINGKPETIKDVPSNTALLWVLRDKLGLTGPKYGCGVDVCKSCTCLVGGVKQTTCSMSLGAAVGKEIITIEGLAGSATAGAKVGQGDEALHIVQKVWIDLDVAQCGFCQPGQIMAAVDLLRRTRNLSGMTEAQKDAAIDQHMDNVCRCGTYDRIRKAIKTAATALGTNRA